MSVEFRVPLEKITIKYDNLLERVKSLEDELFRRENELEDAWDNESINQWFTRFSNMQHKLIMSVCDIRDDIVLIKEKLKITDILKSDLWVDLPEGDH